MVRKSPAEHAKAYMGRRKRGLDGNWWKSLPNQKGIYRWVLQPGKIARSQTRCPTKAVPTNHAGTYFIHDWGSRPFKVVVQKSPLTVFVYKRTGTDPETDLDLYATRPTKTFYPQKVWVGADTNQEHEFIGNTLLLQFPNNVFESPVGNSDVPYPYAVDQKNQFYLLIEGVGMRHVDADDEFDGIYLVYYNQMKDRQFMRQRTFKMKRKVLVKRERY